MMGWTKHGIEGMGYKEYPDTDVLEMSFFGLIRVYSLQGILFEDGCQEKKSEVITLSDRCSIAIAQSVNEASKTLAGDVFFDDEEKFLSETGAIPPFLLIHFKTNEPIELRGGYRKEKDGYIYTYDSFPELGREIAEWEEHKLPNIETCLIVNLSSLINGSIKLIPIDSNIFGVTKEGKTLFDKKIDVSVSCYSSSPKTIKEINLSLWEPEKIPSFLNEKLCKNFVAALNESGRSKQFLRYFQFIEKCTHHTYKIMNSSKDKTYLSKKFLWCATNAWEYAEESDLEDFMEVKNIRDKLSHGSMAVKESEVPLEKIENLASKIVGIKKN